MAKTFLRTALAGLLAVSEWIILPPVAIAQSATKGAQEKSGAGQAFAAAKRDANQMSLEVAALQMLQDLDLTANQRTSLTAIAKTIPADGRKRDAPKASGKFIKALAALHAALYADNDDAIDSAGEVVEALRESEDPDLDDEIEIVRTAPSRAVEFVRTLSFRQLADYVANLDDDVDDPFEKLKKTFEEVRNCPPVEAKEFCMETSIAIGWMLAGPASEESLTIATQAAKLIERARAMDSNTTKNARLELLASAKQLTGSYAASDILRHVVEHDVAELLSNPRLVDALTLLSER